MILSKNIKNLSCFSIDTENNKVNITLDITNEYPDKLLVFGVIYSYNKDDNTCKYLESIQGPEDKVEQLKKQLIHEYEYTEPDN